MIIIRYRGGLGNQMFQYAFQLAMTNKYQNTQVLSDLSHYRLIGEHNGFELDKVFQLKMPCASSREIRKISPYYVSGSIFDKLPSKVQKIVAQNLQYRYKEWNLKRKEDVYYKQEYHSSWEPEVFQLVEEKDWYLDGLWQDFRYYADCEKQIREAFQFCNEERYSEEDRRILSEIMNTASVGIHVRRGDFVNSKFDICTEDYYREAIRLMREKVGQDIRFYFFSDDTQFVEERFAFVDNKEILSHPVENSIVDMEMLSLCRHKIISNSTFAFWAAWLGQQKDEYVIAPRYSIINHGRNFKLRVPEGWQQI